MGTLHQFKKEQEAIQQTGRVLSYNEFDIFVLDTFWHRINVDKRLSRNWKGTHKWNEKKQPKHVRVFISNVVINRMK